MSLTVRTNVNYNTTQLCEKSCDTVTFSRGQHKKIIKLSNCSAVFCTEKKLATSQLHRKTVGKYKYFKNCKYRFERLALFLTPGPIKADIYSRNKEGSVFEYMYSLSFSIVFD